MRLFLITLVSFLLPFCCVCSSCAESVRKSRRGIIVYDDGCHVRAMEPFGGLSSGGSWYAGAVNMYAAEFGRDVRIYNMVIPTAVAFYCPASAAQWTHDEKPVIDNMYSCLSDTVIPVDVYGVLAEHASEDIYLRTDHHWAPLGAYYAAREFARVAEVPFRAIDAYNENVISDFVGTMYRFSGDAAVRKDPENFVYHTPKDSAYATFYTNNSRDGRTSQTDTEPYAGSFFKKHCNGSPSAYCTFMGGDLRNAHVSTSVRNGRKLMIVKDSYGNALPAYLFFSFEDIHVIDFRHFSGSMPDYVRDNGITDILIVNNLLHAYNKSTGLKLEALLKR